MPLNEAKGYRRHGLTREQQRQHDVAFYGIDPNVMISQLSHEEVERMRQIVMAHDSSRNGGIKEFDLNNPPKVPYKFQPYPKMLYDHDARKYMVVNDEAQEQRALDAGWRADPYPSEPSDADQPSLSAADAAEVEAIEAQLKRGPGRPRKVTV